VIAAEYQGHLIRSEYRFNFNRQLFARITYLANILEFFTFLRKRLRPLEPHVTTVVDHIPETRDPLIQTRHAQCGWSNIDTRHARAVTQRNSKDADRSI
jgi:hypothetical protein